MSGHTICTCLEPQAPATHEAYIMPKPTPQPDPKPPPVPGPGAPPQEPIVPQPEPGLPPPEPVIPKPGEPIPRNEPVGLHDPRILQPGPVEPDLGTVLPDPPKKD